MIGWVKSFIAAAFVLLQCCPVGSAEEANTGAACCPIASADDEEEERRQMALNPPRLMRMLADSAHQQTTLRAFFEHPLSSSCFTHATMFSLKGPRVGLLYPLPVDRSIGVDFRRERHGMIIEFRNEHCRTRLRISRESLDDEKWRPLTLMRGEAASRSAPAPTGQQKDLLNGRRFAGDGLYANTLVYLDDPQSWCLNGHAGLLTIWPTGTSLVFPVRDRELPFSVEAKPSHAEQNVSLVFAAPACRVTMQIEMEIRTGDRWVRLPPAVE
jgi:hypothetical protein